MAIGHLAVRPHSRAQGHNAAAAVAYRCGLALTCTRTGERHDFTRRAQREDVVAYGVVGGHIESPAAFAAAVESGEKRRNSRICRDVQMALPSELDDDSRIQLTKAFAAELAERYGTAACWAVHRPDRRSDRRNHHAHILLPTRALAGDGCTFGKKLRVLDDQRRGPEEITEIRRLWESRANEALIAAGQDARVHTGRTTHPEPSLGAKHIAIERQAWQQRHTDFPNGLEWAGGLSAAQLVIDDGVCATRRGRALAFHVRQRAFIAHAIGEREIPRSRPVRAPAPEAAQDLAHAVVAVVPVEEPRPVRAPAPEAAQDLAHAVVAVVPVEEPRPVRAPAPEAVQGLAHAVVAVVPVEEPRPVRAPAPEAVQGLAHAVVAVSPVEEPRPICVPSLTAIMKHLEALIEGRRTLIFKRRMEANEALEREERQRMEYAAKQKLESAFTPEGIEKVGEALIKQHVGYSNAYPSFSGLGRQANKAALDELHPHARKHYVAGKHQFKRGMAGNDYLHHRKALDVALERWRRWWRGGLFSKPQKQIIPEMIRRVWPVYWQETQDNAEKAATDAQAAADQERRKQEALARQARERRDELAAAPVPQRPKRRKEDKGFGVGC